MVTSPRDLLLLDIAGDGGEGWGTIGGIFVKKDGGMEDICIFATGKNKSILYGRE